MPYHTMPIIDEDGNLTKERIASDQIEKTISQKIQDQKYGHTWWDEEVELKDGGKVKIRNVTRDGEYQ